MMTENEFEGAIQIVEQELELLLQRMTKRLAISENDAVALLGCAIAREQLAPHIEVDEVGLH